MPSHFCLLLNIVYSYIACSHLADASLLSSETESSPSVAEQLKAKGLDQQSASGFLAVVGFELVAF